MSVVAYADESGVAEIAIYYLDAGLFLVIVTEGSRRERIGMPGREKRNEFARYYKELSKSLTKRLEDGCGRGEEGCLATVPC